MKDRIKGILLGISACLIVLISTACGKPNTAEATVKELLKGLVQGQANEVAVKYAKNPDILVSNPGDDSFGLRDAMFSRMTYKVKEAKEYKEDATVTLEIKTIYMPHVVFLLRERLKNDDEYAKLSGEAKENHYAQAQANLVKEVKDEDSFRTVTVDITVDKTDKGWKVEISNKFYTILLGQPYTN